jgi:TonB family protein
MMGSRYFPRAWTLIWGLALGGFPVSTAQGQASDSLVLQVGPLSVVKDSAREAMPPSHRSALGEVDRPVAVNFCPSPNYPSSLAAQGIGGTVSLRFVVDTLGIPEAEDVVVVEASHHEFIRSAERAVAKCRFRPAQRAGRPVRRVVQQRVVFPGRDKDPWK